MVGVFFAIFAMFLQGQAGLDDTVASGVMGDGFAFRAFHFRQIILGHIDII